MEQQFIHFLKVLVTQAKEEVESAIKNTINNQLKVLMIYVADDYYMKEDKKWIDSLYEERYLNTSNGGEKFYEYMAYYYDTNNQEMLRLYLISIKFGFSGYYADFPESIYVKYLKKLNLPIEKFHYSPFNSANKPGGYSISLKYFLFLPIGLLILYITIEFFLIRSLIPLINRMYNLLGGL